MRILERAQVPFIWLAGTGEAEEENCIKLSCLRLFLAAFYVVTGLRVFKQPRFQLSGSLELEKQRRKIHLIKVYVVTRIEDILAGTGPSYPVRRNWRRRGGKLI